MCQIKMCQNYMTIVASKEYSLQSAVTHCHRVNKFRVRYSNLQKVPQDACDKAGNGISDLLIPNHSLYDFFNF